MVRTYQGMLALATITTIVFMLMGCNSTTLNNDDLVGCQSNLDCPGGKMCVDGECISIDGDTDPAVDGDTDAADITDNAEDIDAIDTDDPVADGDTDAPDSIDNDDAIDNTDTDSIDPDNDGDSPDQDGPEVPADIISVPDVIDFGIVTAGESQTKNLMISVAANAGSVSISTITTQNYQGEQGCSAYEISAPGSLPLVLAEPSTLALPVSFSPSTAGNHNCLVRIDYGWPGDDPTFSQAAFVTLVGQGSLTNERCIQITPVMNNGTSGINFGSVAISHSKSQTLRIASCSGQTLTINSILLDTSDWNCAMFGICPEYTFSPGLPMESSRQLGPGQFLDIEVTFTPTHAEPQPWTIYVASNAEVSMPDTASGTPGNMEVQLWGQGLDLQYEITPQSLRIPGTPAGCCSEAFSVELSNTGTNALDIDEVILTPGSFEFVNRPSYPQSLAAGATEEYEIRFCPSAQAATGDIRGELQIDLAIPGTNDGDTAVISIESSVVPPQVTDTFHQPNEAKADILWVVDCSGSMGEEQQLLSDTASSFITNAVNRGANLHIGVTSTDMEDSNHQGQLQGNPKVISTDNPQAAISQFEDNVMLGTYCSGTELGLLPMQTALTEPLISGANAGFLRSDARLIVVFLSDEEDQSPGAIDSYVDALAGVKNNNPSMYTAFAIVGNCPGGCSSLETGDASEGCRYTDFAREVEGVTASICYSDYSAVTTAIVDESLSFPDTFLLSAAPQINTLQVRVNNQLLSYNVQYTFDEETNAVYLNTAPAAGATVSISYQALCAN